MTILHNPVKKNVGFRSNFMSVGREHEHETNANVYYPEIWGGRKEKSLSSLGTTSLCIWGPICIPCKMCLISFLKVRSRSKEVISLPIQIFHLIHAITFYQWQKGKKVKKKKRDFLQLYLDFIVSSTFHQSSYCPGKKVLTALGCPPRNPTASPSLGFPVTLTRDRASSWRYCSHKS